MLTRLLAATPGLFDIGCGSQWVESGCVVLIGVGSCGRVPLFLGGGLFELVGVEGEYLCGSRRRSGRPSAVSVTLGVGAVADCLPAESRTAKPAWRPGRACVSSSGSAVVDFEI